MADTVNDNSTLMMQELGDHIQGLIQIYKDKMTGSDLYLAALMPILRVKVAFLKCYPHLENLIEEATKAIAKDIDKEWTQLNG